jgi:hypothetical protein
VEEAEAAEDDQADYQQDGKRCGEDLPVVAGGRELESEEEGERHRSTRQKCMKEHDERSPIAEQTLPRRPARAYAFDRVHSPTSLQPLAPCPTV